MKMNLKVANDNGNSEQAIIINNNLVTQPNVFSEELQFKTVGDKSPAQLMPDLLSNLFVSIDSTSLSGNGMYYIGQAAMDKGTNLINMRAGADKKSSHEVPIINTLGILAGWAVKNVFNEKGELVDKIDLEVEMATALPVSEYKIDGAPEKFQNRFIENKHNVFVHVGRERVDVSIKFNFVKVLPEGTSVLFHLMSKNVEGSHIFDEFTQEYKLSGLTGKYFKDKRVLHVDIGDGTTELPITTNYDFDDQKAIGINVGIAHAIEQAKEAFVAENAGFRELTRQKFSEYLKFPDKHKRYHTIAKRYMSVTLKPIVKQIVDQVRNQLDKSYNEIDLILVYGGGSILSKDQMYPLLKEEAQERLGEDMKVMWVPVTTATLMNVKGLNELLNSKMFEQLKKMQKTLNNFA